MLWPLFQHFQLLLGVLRPVVPIDQPCGYAEVPPVLIYVAGEDGEDVLIQNGGSHL